jgi:hypothetical protein
MGTREIILREGILSHTQPAKREEAMMKTDMSAINQEPYRGGIFLA